jgi:hypothetical protein
VDSLDSLFLLGLTDEFDEAVKWVHYWFVFHVGGAQFQVGGKHPGVCV